MIRKFISFLTAIVLLLNFTVLQAFALEIEPEKILTSKELKKCILSAKVYSNAVESDLLCPMTSGDVTFSEPFRIPYYSVKQQKVTGAGYSVWASALFADDRLCAVIMMSYNKNIVIGCVFYMPYKLTEDIDKGKECSLFWVDEGTGYELMYSMDENGSSNFLFENSSYSASGKNNHKPEDFKSAYADITKFNIISKDMKKSVTVTNASFNDMVFKNSTDNLYHNKYAAAEYKPAYILNDNSVITLENCNGESYNYKGSEEFVIHEQGKDKSGEMTYSLSPENAPNKSINFAGSKKVYLRCAYGGDKPIYKICPVTNPDKAFTVSDGKGKVKKWTDAENQQWYIHIK